MEKEVIYILEYRMLIKNVKVSYFLVFECFYIYWIVFKSIEIYGSIYIIEL